MTQKIKVDFYLIKSQKFNELLLAAPFVLEKIFTINCKNYLNKQHLHATKKIFVACNNQKEAETLDKILWNFKKDSFIPHSIYIDETEQNNKSANQNLEEKLNLEKNLQNLIPIKIGYNIKPENFVQKGEDILLNLTANIMEYQQFNNIIHIVPNNEESKAVSRELYRIYRSKNYILATIDIAVELI